MKLWCPPFLSEFPNIENPPEERIGFLQNLIVKKDFSYPCWRRIPSSRNGSRWCSLFPLEERVSSKGSPHCSHSSQLVAFDFNISGTKRWQASLSLRFVCPEIHLDDPNNVQVASNEEPGQSFFL